MIKKLLVLVFTIHFAFAIQITVSPDKDNNVSVSTIERDALKDFVYKTMNFELTDEGAYKVVRDNRILANEFLKQKKLTDFDKARLRVEAELYLSTRFVKDLQKSIKIPEKVLYSYYLDHKDEFKKEGQVDTVAFFFKSPEEAIAFYNQVKSKDLDFAMNLAKKFNNEKVIVKEYGTRSLKTIKKPLKKFLEDPSNLHKFLPPFIYEPNFATIFYVRSYQPGKGYYSFDKVKKKIEKKLYDRTFLKKRQEILKKYGVNEAN